MARVECAWHPDRAWMFVNRKRDRTLILETLRKASDRDFQSATDLLSRRFSHYGAEDNDLSFGEFSFARVETPTVVGAMVLELDREKVSPLRALRARSLIGQLVVAAGAEYYHSLRQLPDISDTPQQSLT